MKEEDQLTDLLARVGQSVREQRAENEVWEALARGDLAPSPRAELERRALTDPYVATMLAACRPLGASAEERVVARVAPRRTFRLRALTPYVTPLAFAAAVLLMWKAGPREGVGDGGGLPSYDVTAVGERELRGVPSASHRLVLRGEKDSRFEVIARPVTANTGRVSARAFAVRGTDVSPIQADVQLAEGGSVRLRGDAAVLAGATELRLVLSTSPLGEKAGLERARTGVPGDAHVMVLVVPVQRP